jgi:uncharacterized protein (DUF169 family)
MSKAAKLDELLELRDQTVAIAFLVSPPEGMERIDEVALAGCTYWKLAAEGRSFYTEASDHFGCPVGAYTHGIDLPEEQGKELEGLIGTMVDLKYLDPAEVAGIPKREDAFGVAVYAPSSTASFEPDVVLVSGNAKQMMLLAEAVQSAGIDCDASLVGRPTCAALAAVIQSGNSTANLGCIGNRVYTERRDDELYFVFSGSVVDRLVDKLGEIVHANQELEKYHSSRLG